MRGLWPRRGRSKKHKYADGGPGNQSITNTLSKACSNPLGRNKRTVWAIETQPFGGSGTTTLVTMMLGRDSIYIDLNPQYLELALKRTGFKDGRLFNCHTYEVIGHSA